MARSRFMKPEFFDDPVLARCSHPARLLFAACWQVADRLGVFEWDCAKLRKYAFGYEDITASDVGKMLDELLRHGFIKHATFKEKEYGYVVNLAKHQKFHVAEKSKFDDVAAGAIWQSSTLGTLPAPTQHPADTVSESLSLETENGDGERRTDLLVPQAETSGRKKRQRSANEQADAKLVREAFHEAYRKYYGKPIDRWGAPENAHVYHLLKSSGAEVLAEKATRYFAWKRPEVIGAGHPFMNHRSSFSATLAELTADINAPQRRHFAAQLKQRERLSDEHAADEDQINRIAKDEQADAYAVRGSRRESLDAAWRPPTGTPAALDQAAGVSAGNENLGRAPAHLRQAPIPIRDDERALRGVFEPVRGRAHAEHPPDTSGNGDTGGPPTGTTRREADR